MIYCSSFAAPKHRCPARLPAAAVAVCLAVLAACGGTKNAKAGGGPAGPAVPVVVAPVRQENVPVYAELTARTDASDTVDVRARVRAYLAAQHFQEGRLVKKGQLLLTLDKRKFEAQLMQARAALAKAEADLAQAQERTVVETAQSNLEISLAQLNKTDHDVNRLKPLAEQRAVPQQDYDDALAAQRAARADVAGAPDLLRRSPEVPHSLAFEPGVHGVREPVLGLRDGFLGGPHDQDRHAVRLCGGLRLRADHAQDQPRPGAAVPDAAGAAGYQPGHRGVPS